MTLNDKIYNLRGKINWENNKDIRETLVFPYDFYRAYEQAFIDIGRIVPLIERTIFLPLNSSSNKQLLLNLTKLGLVGYKMVKPLQAFHVIGATMEAVRVSNEILDRAKEESYINLNTLYYKRPYNFGVTINTTEEPVLGTYMSITNVSSPATITTDVTMTAGAKILNLSKALSNIYSSAVPASTNTTSAMDKNVILSPYNWAIGDKLYQSATECGVVAIVLQIIPQILFFDTYTLPIYNTAAEMELDSFAEMYLYSFLKNRFPEYLKVYSEMLITNTKLTTELLTKIVYPYEQIWFEKQ